MAGAAGVVAGSAAMAGLWALGHWGTAWLVSQFSGQASPPTASAPFAFGPTTAVALAVAFGLTATLSMELEMTANRGPNRGPPACQRPSTPS